MEGRVLCDFRRMASPNPWENAFALLSSRTGFLEKHRMGDLGLMSRSQVTRHDRIPGSLWGSGV